MLASMTSYQATKRKLTILEHRDVLDPCNRDSLLNYDEDFIVVSIFLHLTLEFYRYNI